MTTHARIVAAKRVVLEEVDDNWWTHAAVIRVVQAKRPGRWSSAVVFLAVESLACEGRLETDRRKMRVRRRAAP